jgi:hypothetical protein
MNPGVSTLSSSNLNLYPRSMVTGDVVEYALAQTNAGLRLVVLADLVKSPDPSGNQDCFPEIGITKLEGFEGEISELAGKTLLIGPCNPQNAATLRARLGWLRPQLLGLRTSAGLGDRIGLATPGHVRAIRTVGGNFSVPDTNPGIAPIFAQQSMREMARTGRTPQQVMDDATWGIFQEGWQGGAGADADHLKTPADIDTCLAAGFTFFTIDPGVHVDNRAETASLGELRELAARLPVEIQPGVSGLLGKKFDIEGMMLYFNEAALLKAAVKYGKAITHVASMYRHLVKVTARRFFELEVSVDETEQPTSHAEHLYIAMELKRLGVIWVSLAPRYVGSFEKGVDYIGDLTAFERDLAGHTAIARQFGPYKLSLHSGSDKYSIYPAAMRQTHGLVHLKTAGTSYLEALRTIAMLDVDLFREIYIFSRQHYDFDKASYHVSAKLSCAPIPEDVEDWPGILDQFDAREILHVTFGSVLTGKPSNRHWCFKEHLVDFLRSNPEVYAANLERHFIRHLSPFVLH